MRPEACPRKEAALLLYFATDSFTSLRHVFPTPRGRKRSLWLGKTVLGFWEARVKGDRTVKAHLRAVLLLGIIAAKGGQGSVLCERVVTLLDAIDCAGANVRPIGLVPLNWVSTIGLQIPSHLPISNRRRHSITLWQVLLAATTIHLNSQEQLTVIDCKLCGQ